MQASEVNQSLNGFVETAINTLANVQGEEELLKVLGRMRLALEAIPVEDRLLQWTPHVAQLVIGLCQDVNLSMHIHVACWNILIASVRLSFEQADDEIFNPVLDFAVNDLDFLRLIIQELHRYESHPQQQAPGVIVCALVVLTRLCLAERHAMKVCIFPTLVSTLLEIVRVGILNAPGQYALICLANLAIHVPARESLAREGTVRAILQIRPRELLQSSNPRMLDCGLSAACILCRLTGEHGKVLGDNKLLISKLLWLLNRVINAGPHGSVLGSRWQPANIVMDVSLLATSDDNKRSMADFVPLIIEALRVFGLRNARLELFAVRALYQLHFEPSARVHFHDAVIELPNLMKRVRQDAEAMQIATFLNATYGGGAPTVPRARPSLVGFLTTCGACAEE